MSETARAVRERAEELMPRAANWHEYRRLLEAEGLVDRLGPEGLQAVLAEWNRRAAAALNDIELRVELCFWADGGSYAAHLRGYQAIPPAELVEQARARGWFVRVGASGTALVNPPGARPLTIRLGPAAN
jgi:hypothetical protein